MRKLKSFCALFLALALTLSLCSPAFAAEQPQVDAANTLYTLGLFSGTGTDAAGKPNFDLDRTPTRAEAVVMLVRLLGKEAEAKAGQWQTPFTDTAAYSWALPYIGYAYTNGLAQGNGTIFDGGAPTTATQYLTFVLRALGYDSKTDFQWDKAVDFSSSLGLYFNANQAFTRGTVADVSLQTLSLTKKGDTVTLLQKLVDGGAVTEATATSVGLEYLLRDPSAPATRADVAHFLVSNFPIKRYSNIITLDNISDIDNSTRYADDILTVINAGALGTVFDDRFYPSQSVTHSEFASILYTLFVNSGCNVEAVVPYNFDSKNWYDNAIAFAVSLGIFTKEVDPFKAISMQLLDTETVDKLKVIPDWDKVGTVNTYSEYCKFNYVELNGKVCELPSWESLSVEKIDVNGVVNLYISAPTAYITSADWNIGNTSYFSSFLSYAVGDYTIKATDNPFLDGQVSQLGNKKMIQTTSSVEFLNATRKKAFYTVTTSGKSLTSTDFPAGGIADVKGIEYVNGYLKIEDVLAYYGIKKTVTIEQQGDLEVLCFR